MGRSGVGSPGLDQRAIRVGARQAPGAVEHGQGPIRLFMDPHRDRHLMEPGGDSAGSAGAAPATAPYSPGPRPAPRAHTESRRGASRPRGGRRGPVPSPPPETGYDAAGERARAETGWPPPAPESRPAPTLRAVGPARCGAPASTEACRRGRPPPRWARRAHPGRERGNGRAPRPCCLDEEGRIDFGGRISPRHTEIPLTTGAPCMGRAVRMQPHPRQGVAWSLLAMCAASSGPRDMPRGLQGLRGPAIVAGAARVGAPALRERLHGPTGLSGLSPRHHPPRRIHWHGPG